MSLDSLLYVESWNNFIYLIPFIQIEFSRNFFLARFSYKFHMQIESLSISNAIPIFLFPIRPQFKFEKIWMIRWLFISLFSCINFQSFQFHILWDENFPWIILKHRNYEANCILIKFSHRFFVHNNNLHSLSPECFL